MGFFDIFRKRKDEKYVPIFNENTLKVEICVPVKEKVPMLKPRDIYKPDTRYSQKFDVVHIELDYEQAIRNGWHFRRKSNKRIRITRYTGKEKNIIIPAKIGGYIVNEIGSEAFRNTNIDSVRIPDTVKKLNEKCFYASNVKSVTFADGVEKIPAEAFMYCRSLVEINLPYNLHTIERRAFFCCNSLKFVHIPRYCHVYDEAFKYSGLTDFKNFHLYSHGSAFQSTPLHQKYRLILKENHSYLDRNVDNYCIGLVGSGAEIKFPKNSVVYLDPKSVVSPCMLDFSACNHVNISVNAFMKNVPCKVIMPESSKYEYFPDFVEVRYPDGSEYHGIFENKGESSDGTVIEICDKYFQMPAFSIRQHVQNLALKKGDFITFAEHAVSIPELESFRTNCISIEGELFSPLCHNLHKVTFNKCLDLFAYIPSSEVVGKEIHSRLLKAFRGRHEGGMCQFFDSSLIDDVFYDNRISQRNRIFIAVDVLRSKQNLFPNRNIYAKYLKNHKKYVQIICDRIPDKWHEYSDFLKKFY